MYVLRGGVQTPVVASTIMAKGCSRGQSMVVMPYSEANAVMTVERVSIRCSETRTYRGGVVDVREVTGGRERVRRDRWMDRDS